MTTDMNEIKSMMERMTVEIANFTMRQNQLEGQHEKTFAELKDSIDEVRRYDRGKNQEVHDTGGGNAEIYTPSGNPMAWLPHVAGLPPLGNTLRGFFAMGASPLPPFSAQGDTMTKMEFPRSRSHIPYPSWEEYVYALMDKFGAEYADPMSELKLVKQNGTMEDYQKEFDRIMIRNTELQVNAQLKLTKSSMFGNNSSSHPRGRSYSQPKSGSYGGNFRGSFSRKEGNPPRREGVANFNRSNTRRLTPAEMSEKMLKRLCFFCDEKFVPGHKCQTSKQLYLLEVIDEQDQEVEENTEVQEVVEVGEEEQGEICEISVHALTGIPGFHTMRVVGYNDKRPLNILIAHGSTCNFIDEDLVKQLGLKVQAVRPQSVNVADGSDRQTAEMCHQLS
ncbi:hypothetical protein H5410_018326 [Solanum commersonii]|uniref:Retrotransposon gag domain-containing protein n=1 Tax=Solanum commersonii TaxID=4109 RepID=A0A9J6A1M2_SOLCO|nr:hypothetical protein H5410_018326 [Solanum commersonii]